MPSDRMPAIRQAGAFFVIVAKENFRFRCLYSQHIDKSTGLQCDQIITTKNYYARKDYAEKLRRIRFFNKDNNRHLVFLTNNFTLQALTVAGGRSSCSSNGSNSISESKHYMVPPRMP